MIQFSNERVRQTYDLIHDRLQIPGIINTGPMLAKLCPQLMVHYSTAQHVYRYIMLRLFEAGKIEPVKRGSWRVLLANNITYKDVQLRGGVDTTQKITMRNIEEVIVKNNLKERAVVNPAAELVYTTIKTEKPKDICKRILELCEEHNISVATFTAYAQTKRKII